MKKVLAGLLFLSCSILYGVCPCSKPKPQIKDVKCSCSKPRPQIKPQPQDVKCACNSKPKQQLSLNQVPQMHSGK
jgi:hypothetical protein